MLFQMLLRKPLLIVLLSLTSLASFAQISRNGRIIKNQNSSKKFHIGYSFGINVAGFSTVPADEFEVSLQKNPGINLNLIADYKLKKNWNLRFLPGIQFIERDLTIKDLSINKAKVWKIESIYLDMPLLLKHSLKRVRNHAPYVIGGLAPRFDLLGTENETFRASRRMLGLFDIYPEIGVGMDFYLARVKFATELKFSLGLADLFTDPGDEFYQLYTSGIEKIFSRMVVLSFHVE